MIQRSTRPSTICDANLNSEEVSIEKDDAAAQPEMEPKVLIRLNKKVCSTFICITFDSLAATVSNKLFQGNIHSRLSSTLLK